MEQIAINILPKGAKPVCHSSQFDEGRQIMFKLLNDATPYTLSGTETISVLVRKPDGAEVVDSVTNTSDNYVIWDVSADACELSGVCECELSIVENGIVLGSKNFTMKVEEDAYGGRNIEVRTASGAIATFETNMVEAFKSLKSDITPVQDLHGYSKPWIGGGGKNKLEVTATSGRSGGVDFIVNSDGSVTANVPAERPSNAWFPIATGINIAAGSILSGGISNDVFVHIISSQGTQLYKSGATEVTITEDLTNVTVRLGIYSGIVSQTYTFLPMIRTSGNSTWEPYENICPISGFNSANIVGCGVNLWNEQWELGGIGSDGNNIANTDRIRSKNYIPVKPNLSVFINYSDSRTVNFYVCEYDINKTFIQRTTSNKNTVFTTSANCCFIRFFVYSSVNPITTYNNDISINYPSSDTEYHAYNGQTATVNFGQTVYGGVADVTNGKLTITHEYCVFNGTETITSNTQGGHTRFSCQKLVNLADNNASNENFCSHFIASSSPIGQNQIDNAIGVYNRVLYWRADQFTDITAMKNYLLAQYNANTPVMYVAKLATPTEITTTPENLTAISGENNVYSDTNGDTTVEYYIEV